MFVYIHTHFCFVLIGRNLTAQSRWSHGGITGGIQIPKDPRELNCSQANLTWAKHRQITWKTLTFSCKSSHGISHSQLIQDLRCKPAVLKRRHGAPAFHTIFNKVFGLVLNQHQFRSHWRDLTSRTCFLRPKTFYCQNKAHNILSFCLNPGSVFHPCSQMRQNTSR